MSKIIPFKALVPKREIAALMISPPYDVIESAEAREWVQENPFSFLHITKSEVDLPEDKSPYDNEVYEKAADNLRMFEERGYLVHREASFYVYRQVMGGYLQTGVVCGVSVDEYDGGLIKKHEHTREEKVADRTRHAYMAKAHTEPVMLVHRASEPIFHLINEAEARGEPLYDIVDRKGVRHILWPAKNTVALQKVFDGIEALYIADGHHRSESASRVRSFMKEENPRHKGSESYNYFPAVVYPDNEVRVCQYDWDGDQSQRPLSKYSMNDIMKLADDGGIMPPKSTWFAPKLGSGLFVYTF